MGVMVLAIELRADDLFTEVFEVPPTILGFGIDPMVDPFGDPAKQGDGVAPKGRRRALDVLEEAGITFGEGCTAIYNRETSQLIVRNTRQQLMLVQEFVDGIRDYYSKLIYVTFREVTFEGDPFKSSENWGEFTEEFLQTPDDELPENGFSLKSVLERLSQATTAQDDGEISIAEVFTDPQFQVLIRAMKESGKFKIFSLASVMSRQGQVATVETKDRKYGAVTEVGMDSLSVTVDLMFDDPPSARFNVTIYDRSTLGFLEAQKDGENRIVFTTFQLMDPAGEPLNRQGEKAADE